MSQNYYGVFLGELAKKDMMILVLYTSQIKLHKSEVHYELESKS